MLVHRRLIPLLDPHCYSSAPIHMPGVQDALLHHDWRAEYCLPSSARCRVKTYHHRATDQSRCQVGAKRRRNTVGLLDWISSPLTDPQQEGDIARARVRSSGQGANQVHGAHIKVTSAEVATSRRRRIISARSREMAFTEPNDSIRRMQSLLCLRFGNIIGWLS